MLRIMGLILISLICLQSRVTADEPDAASAEVKQAVTRLIQKLDDNQRSVRQQAELKLVELGKPVLTLLPPPELVSSQSVREALVRVRLQIEKQAARESIQASRINLTGRFTLKHILQEISQQTGNQLDLTHLSDTQLKQRLNVRFDNTSFWKAIDDLSTKQMLVYRINGPRDQLQFLEQSADQRQTSPANPKVCYNGPFRISIDDLQSRPLAGSPDRELLRITFLIQAEPRLRPLFLSYAASKLKAQGVSGMSLPPFNPSAKYELPLGEGGKNLKFTMQWILNSKERPPQVKVQGNLEMELAAETLPITFDDLTRSQGAVRRRGNVSVELIETERTNQDLNVRIALSYDYGGPAFESHRTWIYHNRAYLEDAQGKKFWLDGSSQTTLESMGKIGVLYRFRNLPTSASKFGFTYLAPTLITAAPIELNFDQLKLTESK